jgi:hypothetical protein
MNTLENITIIIRIQNVNLLKYIAWKEGWDYLDLCKKYLQ